MLVDGAVRRHTPDGAALLRLLMALGTQDTKRAASRALAELTSAGVYPPDWVTEIGKVTPGQAWRRYDVFGDDEAIAVTFGYGEAEHGVVVQVDLAGIPVASAIGVSSNAARLIEAITRRQRGARPVRADQPGRGAPSPVSGRWTGPTVTRTRTCPPIASRTCRSPGPGSAASRPNTVPAAGVHRGRPRGRGRRVHEEPAGRRGGRGRRGVHAVLGRGARRLQRPRPRRAAGPGRSAQARAHTPRPRAEHLRPVSRAAQPPRARGDRVGPLVRRKAGPGRGRDRGAGGSGAEGAQPGSARRTTTRTRSRSAATRPAWPPATPTWPGSPTTWGAACSRCRCRSSTVR